MERKRGRPRKSPDGALAEDSLGLKVTERQRADFEALLEQVNAKRFGLGEKPLSKTDLIYGLIQRQRQFPVPVEIPQVEAALLAAMVKQDMTTEVEFLRDLLLVGIREEAKRRNIFVQSDDSDSEPYVIEVLPDRRTGLRRSVRAK